MSFAGVDNLKLTCVFGDQPQTVEIGKNQIRAFVTGGPASKADGENFFVQAEARFHAHGFEQFVLGDKVGRPNFFGGKSERASQAVIVLAPLSDVAVKQKNGKSGVEGK